MYSKVKISGRIKIVTGLHIGTGGEYSAIGAVDSPVVKDPKTKLPIIPGSSIKGKLRSLLSRHVSGIVPVADDSEEVNRLFGSSTQTDGQGRLIQARLQISDAFYSERSKEEFEKREIPFTETKFENTIDRITAEANPRQIERVVRGSYFDVEIIYNVNNEEEVKDDLENLQIAFNLLENDYLGGGGTRGSGRVAFEGLNAIYVTGPSKGEVAYEFTNN